MPIINFPIPTYIGEPYTFGNKTWIWNGSSWDFNGSVVLVPGYPTKATHIFSHGEISPVDSTVYYFGDLPDHIPQTEIVLGEVDNGSTVMSLHTGTISEFSIVTHLGATATTESSTIYVKNLQTGATALLTNSLKHNSEDNDVGSLFPPISVTIGDPLVMYWITPNWIDQPTQVRTRVEIKIDLA